MQDKLKEKNPSNRYYMARIDDWKTTEKRPTAVITECIGEAGNLAAETLRILKANDICTEQYEEKGGAEAVHESLKVFTKELDESGDWKIPEKEIESRLDLRKRRTFTIDPISARDLDDALSIEHIRDSVYEIGVHIADVSYFVQQGTDLDMEALKRGTSTYFTHQVFPMLPRLLSERLCSLNPNVDRLTYSIFYRLDLSTGAPDPSYVPVIKRSVIRSCAKWNYELVQKILEDEVTSEDQLEESMRPQGQKFEDLASDVFTMNMVAQARRKKRFEAGSIEFNNREFNFTLNEATQYPINYSESPRMQSKQLVEEFMLLANILVAEHLF